MGAYVHLLEYNDVQGMILLSELSRRRIRSIQKLIRVGRNEVVVVLRVDKDKGKQLFFFFFFCGETLTRSTGYIDLSKRRVSDEEIVKCEEKYNKSKAVRASFFKTRTCPNLISARRFTASCATLRKT